MRSIFRVGAVQAPAPTRNLFAALRDFDLPTRGRLSHPTNSPTALCAWSMALSV